MPVIHAPYTALELLETGWCHRVRKAILDQGNAVRIGNQTTIEAQCINEPDRWLSIMLPNGGTKLVDMPACVTVIRWLQGHEPLPDLTVPPS